MAITKEKVVTGSMSFATRGWTCGELKQFAETIMDNFPNGTVIEIQMNEETWQPLKGNLRVRNSIDS